MQEITRAVTRASRRLLLSSLVRSSIAALTIAAGTLVITRLAQQTLGFRVPWFAPYGGVVAWTAGSWLLMGIAWTLLTRMPRSRVASTLDERAGLRERLSTALSLKSQDDAWSQTVIEDARRVAVTADVRRAIPVRAPAWWWSPLGASALLAIVWFAVPRIDIFGKAKKRDDQRAAVQQAALVKEEVKATENKLAEMLAKTKVELPQETEASASANEQKKPETAEEIQRAAVRRLTDLTDKLAAEKNGEAAKRFEAMREAMKRLTSPMEGPLDDMQRQMARGNFEQARMELEQFSKSLAEKSLTEEQKTQAKKQLESLSKQLEEIAKKNELLAKELEKAGVSREEAEKLAKTAASNPEALKDAIEQMKNLSPEQKQALAKAAKAAAKAAAESAKMSDAAKQMSQGMSKEGMSQTGAEGMAELGSSLSQSEQLDQEMDALDAAMTEASGQLEKLGQCLAECNGTGEGVGKPDSWKISAWKAGDSTRRGAGTGGSGKGYGAQKDDTPSDFQLQKERVKVANTGGPIIGSRYVWGAQVKGESVADFQAAVDAGAQAASEAFETNNAPPHLRAAIRKYYGTLTEAAKPAGDAAKVPPVATPVAIPPK